MNKLFLKSLMISIFSVFLIVGSTSAAPFTFGSDGGAGLQGVLDGITVGPNPGVSSVDVTSDALYDSIDSYWSITGTGGSISTIVIELTRSAAFNTFGIYDRVDKNNYVELFDGGASTGAQVAVGIQQDGSVHKNFSDTGIDFADNLFGFYLDNTLVRWYSDTSLNSDSIDHMATYQGTNTDTVQIDPWASGLWTNNEYVLAFEDLAWDGIPDPAEPELGDYNDFVVMVESINPIPEPATMLLFGTGLIGIAGLGRKKIFKSK